MEAINGAVLLLTVTAVAALVLHLIATSPGGDA